MRAFPRSFSRFTCKFRTLFLNKTEFISTVLNDDNAYYRRHSFYITLPSNDLLTDWFALDFILIKLLMYNIFKVYSPKNITLNAQQSQNVEFRLASKLWINFNFENENFPLLLVIIIGKYILKPI